MSTRQIVLLLLFSVAKSYPTLWDPMNSSTPGLPVHHQLPESTQTHVHWVSDAMSVQSCNGDTKSLREKNVLLSDKWLKGKYCHYFPMLWFMTKLIFFPSHNYSPDKQVLSFSKFRNTVFLCQIWKRNIFGGSSCLLITQPLPPFSKSTSISFWELTSFLWDINTCA